MDGVKIVGPGERTGFSSTADTAPTQGVSVVADTNTVNQDAVNAEFAASLPEGITPEMVEKLKANGFDVAKKITPDPATPAPKVEPQSQGFDTTPFIQEFQSTGDLTAESRESIKNHFKIDDTTLDLYMEGAKARQAKHQAQVLGSANLTQDEFKKMAAWSQANETPEMIAARNKQLADKDPEVVKGALLSLQNSYVTGMNATVEPELVRHGGTITNSAITNDAQLQAAISDPRYTRTDAVGEAYRRLVQSRLRF